MIVKELVLHIAMCIEKQSFYLFSAFYILFFLLFFLLGLYIGRSLCSEYAFHSFWPFFSTFNGVYMEVGKLKARLDQVNTRSHRLERVIM